MSAELAYVMYELTGDVSIGLLICFRLMVGNVTLSGGV